MLFFGWIIFSFLLGSIVGFIGFRANGSDDESTYGSDPDPTGGRGSDVLGRR